MKIYRYTYIKKEIKITEFECAKTYNGDYIICDDSKLYKKVIRKDTLNKMIDNANYIMWSLENNKSTYFRILIIDRKTKIYEKKKQELMDLEDEIKMLRR